MITGTLNDFTHEKACKDLDVYLENFLIKLTEGPHRPDAITQGDFLVFKSEKIT